jgi:hypothetical protein
MSRTLDLTCHVPAEALVDPDELLVQLRLQVNAAELAPSQEAAAVHRRCAVELAVLMDRWLTAGHRLPTAWQHADHA